MTCQLLGAAFSNSPLIRLVHFTPIENLSSILEQGLLSRMELRSRGLKYLAPDKKRYDRFLNHISLSLNRPNRLLLMRLKKRYQEQEFVILTFCPSLLWGTTPLFFPDNAASVKFRDSPVSQFKGQEALLQFLNADKRPEGVPNDVLCQREILVPKIIDIRYCKLCVFQAYHSSEPYRERLKMAGVDFKISPNSFKTKQGGVI